MLVPSSRVLHKPPIESEERAITWQTGNPPAQIRHGLGIQTTDEERVVCPLVTVRYYHDIKDVAASHIVAPGRALILSVPCEAWATHDYDPRHSQHGHILTDTTTHNNKMKKTKWFLKSWIANNGDLQAPSTTTTILPLSTLPSHGCGMGGPEPPDRRCCSARSVSSPYPNAGKIPFWLFQLLASVL